MSEDNRAKRFDDFNKLTAEKKQQELWLIGDMNKGTLRDIAKNVGTMLEQMDALVTTTVKNEFKNPVAPTPVTAPVQTAVPANAPPARQPDPVQPPQPQQNLDDVEAWIPERGEIEVLKSQWKENQYGWSADSKDHLDLVKAIKADREGKLDYGDYVFKLGGDNEGFINLNPRNFRDPDSAPSAGQVKFATTMGIDVPEGCTKKQISLLLSDAILAKRRG